MGTLLAFAIVSLGVFAGRAVLAGRSRRHALAGDFDCAIRRVGTKQWEHGQARVAPGELSFRRTARRGGVRLGVEPTPPRVISVTAVDTQGRRPTAREAWFINPSARIFRLTSGDGSLEWAVVAPDAARVARTVAEGQQELE